jgi:hypothetical protein
MIPVISPHLWSKKKKGESRPIESPDQIAFEIEIGERCYKCEEYIGLDNLGKEKLCDECKSK